MTESKTLVDRVGAEFLRAGRAEGYGYVVQDIIDHAADHNQLMLDSIREVSPDLSRLIDELMRVDTVSETGDEFQVAYDTWCNLVNMMFEAARAQEDD